MMKRDNILARLFRAVSGQTQIQLAQEIGVHPSLVGQWEMGTVTPSAEHLRRAAATAGLTVADGELILDHVETLRRRNRRRGEGVDDLFDNLAGEVRDLVEGAYRRLLTLPLDDRAPRADDRRRAEVLWDVLEPLEPESRLAVVRLVEDYQSWALCEKACDESIRLAPHDLAGAAALVELALEIADHVRGTEAWRKRVRGYALAHQANILRLRGDLTAADEVFSAAKSLWSAGGEPGGFLGTPGF